MVPTENIQAEEQPLNIRDDSDEENRGDDDDSYKSCNDDIAQ